MCSDTTIMGTASLYRDDAPDLGMQGSVVHDLMAWFITDDAGDMVVIDAPEGYVGVPEGSQSFASFRPFTS